MKKLFFYIKTPPNIFLLLNLDEVNPHFVTNYFISQYVICKFDKNNNLLENSLI